MREQFAIFVTFLAWAQIASAGWFSPSPSELIASAEIFPDIDSRFTLPVDLSDRSSYEFSLVLLPRSQSAFCDPTGKVIAFEMSLIGGDFVHEIGSGAYQLDGYLGSSFVVRVPGDLPKASYEMVLLFSEIGVSFDETCGGARILVKKMPYIRFLD